MSDKTVAQKMYLHKAGAIAVLNGDAAYPPLLAELPAQLMAATGPADCVLLFAHSQAEVAAWLPRALARLTPAGFLWVAYAKGGARRGADLHRDTIMACAEAHGLKGVGLIAVDQDWSCLRLKRAN